MERKIILRREAIALGLKRYFTGKPCKRGHVCERDAAGCVECHREYYSNNRDQIRSQQAATHKANPIRDRLRSKAWQKANPEKAAASRRARLDKEKSCDLKAMWPNPTARQKALQLGLKTYFTDKPCKRGHLCERHVGNNMCKECARLKRQDNKEKLRAKGAVYYRTNRETILAKERERYRANPTQYNIRSKHWYSRNPEKSREKSRKWGARNPEKRSLSANRWRLKNLNKCALRERRRRALKRARGSFSIHDIKHLLHLQCNRCYWCFSPLNDKYHIDHFIPLSRCGSNDIENIVISCPGCNEKKNDKMPWEFCEAPFARQVLIYAQNIRLS